MNRKIFTTLIIMLSVGLLYGQSESKQLASTMKKTEVLCDTTKNNLILLVKDGNYFIADNNTKEIKDLKQETLLIITNIPKEEKKGFARFVDRCPVCKDKISSVLYVVTKKNKK